MKFTYRKEITMWRQHLHASAARRVVLACAGSLLAVAVLAGCSDDTTDGDTATEPSSAESSSAESSSTGSSPSDVCADVDTAKASLQAVVGTDILKEGTDTLKARVDTLESDVKTLLESRQAELAPEAAAAEESLATLKDVLSGLKESPTAADLAQVRPSFKAVTTSVETLFASLGSTC
jgi:hypothetical protein